MSEIVLRAKNIAKEYSGKAVLRDINLEIAQGQCVALMGHNGSGKSTLLRMLAGLARVTSGGVWRRKGATFGYVPESFPKMELTAAQYLAHMGRIEGMDGQAADRRTTALCKDFFLDGLLDVPMKHLSKGTLQKVGVVQALLCKHDVLLLDEPLSGQDAASQKVFIEKAAACTREGTAIVLSCHEPFLVNRLADTVYEIEKGTLHPVSMKDDRLVETDRLVFAMDAAKTLPPGITSAIVDGDLVITSPQNQSQALLLAMLREGYILKEFYHGNDC